MVLKIFSNNTHDFKAVILLHEYNSPQFLIVYYGISNTITIINNLIT